MVKPGRNDQCVCGSGKKYKKCCGNSKVVSMDQILDQELQDLQMDLIRFAHLECGQELENELDLWFEEVEEIPEELEEILAFHLANWIIFTMDLYNGGSIYERYAKKQKIKAMRPAIRAHFQTWAEATPTIARVEEVRSDEEAVIRDIITKKSYTIKNIDREEIPLEENILVYAIVVPYGEVHTFFTTYLDVPEHINTAKIEKDIITLLNKTNTDPNEFLLEMYPELLMELLLNSFITDSILNIKWDQPEYEEVAKGYAKDQEAADIPATVIQLGLLFWKIYCGRANPKIKNPSQYIATLRYLMGYILNSSKKRPSQKGIAEEYGVTSSSISTRFRDMKVVLAPEIKEVYDDMLADARAENEILKAFHEAEQKTSPITDMDSFVQRKSKEKKK